MSKYAKRRDTTEAEIRDALERVGALVMALDSFDLLVAFGGRLAMLDCKTPKSKRGRIVVTDSQKRLIALGWPLHLVKSPAEALAVLGIRS